MRTLPASAGAVTVALMPVSDDTIRLIDREAIRDVLHRYCRAVDRRDLALLKSCYHSDGLDQHAVFTGKAHDFCEYAMRQQERAVFTQHRLYNISFQFKADRAFTESYVSVLTRVDTQAGKVDFNTFGRYCDLHELRDDGWKILYRLHLADGDTVAKIDEIASRRRDAEGAQGARFVVRSKPSTEDPSYLGFEIQQLYRDAPAVEDMWRHYLEGWNKEKTP
jgi:SnoaL-like domain